LKVVYTIGHSNRTLEEFLSLLAKYSIKTLVDVRRFPSSRKYPHFNKGSLAEELKKLGIKYVWLGELLGGFRKGGYEKYMETEDYRRGIERLVRLMEEASPIAVMCKERLWFKCHRRFIADTLVRLGYTVVHIIDEKREYRHKSRRQREGTTAAN